MTSAQTQKIDRYLKEFYFKSDIEHKELYTDTDNKYLYCKMEDHFIILNPNQRNFWVLNVIDIIYELPNNTKKIKELISNESDYQEKLEYITEN